MACSEPAAAAKGSQTRDSPFSRDAHVLQRAAAHARQRTHALAMHIHTAAHIHLGMSPRALASLRLPCSQPRPLLVRLRLHRCQRVMLLSSRQIH